MMYTISVVVCLLVLISVPSNYAKSNEKILVTLYYESLCPDCHEFFTKQLKPSYDLFKEFVDIHFIPFGNAHSIVGRNGTHFECQHGPTECDLNMMQSCALTALGNHQPDAQMKYTACQNSPSADHTGKECAELLNIVPNIKQCMKSSNQGVLLQLEAERLTRLVNPNGVPCVTFNDVFDQHRWDEALENYPKVVCEMIDFKAPSCNEVW